MLSGVSLRRHSPVPRRRGPGPGELLAGQQAGHAQADAPDVAEHEVGLREVRQQAGHPDIGLTAHEVDQRPVTVDQLLGPCLQSLQIMMNQTSNNYVSSLSPLMASWELKLAWGGACGVTSRWRERAQPPVQPRPL